MGDVLTTPIVENRKIKGKLKNLLSLPHHQPSHIPLSGHHHLVLSFSMAFDRAGHRHRVLDINFVQVLTTTQKSYINEEHILSLYVRERLSNSRGHSNPYRLVG